MNRQQVATAGAAAVLGMVTMTGPAIADTTTLTFKVTNCDGCTISAQTWVLDDWEDVNHSRPQFDHKQVVVRSGSATMRVPTEVTRGMAFSMHRGRLWVMYEPWVALHYRGQPIGSHVSARQASAAKRGSYCWAGTTKARVTLRLGYSRWQEDQPVGSYAERVWSKTTLPTWRDRENMLRTPHGILGTQNPPFCLRNR